MAQASLRGPSDNFYLLNNYLGTCILFSLSGTWSLLGRAVRRFAPPAAPPTTLRLDSDLTEILKDHDACLKGDGTGCPRALAWVFWSHEDGEMHRIG